MKALGTLLLVSAWLGIQLVANAEERPRVAILHTSVSDPFEQAREALLRDLVRDLGASVELVDRRIAPEEPRDAEWIAALDAEVLVPIGSQAALWALDQTEATPIVFAMVLHPVESGIVASLQRPGGRVTGAALDIPLAQQFRTLRQVVGAERVAVLYDPGQTGAQVARAIPVARREGVELVAIEMTDPRLLEASLERVDRSFDALWSLADRTVMSRGAVERILLHTLHERIPFLGLSEQFVRAGALLALVSSHEENGRQAARRVRQVLAGAAPASLPVATPDQIEIVWNPHTARRLRFAPRAHSSLPLRQLD